MDDMENEVNVMSDLSIQSHSIWLGLQAHKISISASLVSEDLDPSELMGFKMIANLRDSYAILL